MKLNNILGVFNQGEYKVLCLFGRKIRLWRRKKRESNASDIADLLKNPKVIAVLKSYTLPSINRDQVASLAENLTQRGTNDGSSRDQKIIVSLTSYPQRMYDIHLCLYSLLVQDFKPDKLILWLAKEQFPNEENDIPRRVLALKACGLEIRWCDDIRSYKKLIPALQEFPDDIIVTADDDIYYPTEWLRRLWEAHCEDPTSIIAHRCRRIAISDNKILPYRNWVLQKSEKVSSFLNFMTGAGGVLYPPKSLHREVSNSSLFVKLCPSGDDIWFWSMAVLQGTKIAIPKASFHNLVYVNPLREANLLEDNTLYSINENGENDAQISKMLDSYPELKSTLTCEFSRFIALSVIIPVYNAAKWLPRCLNSVFSQTLQNIEIICINDGSVDNSQEILDEWARKHNNLRIITQNNSGSAAARNIGIKEARGEYVGFVDADDEVASNYFELLYRLADETGADISATSKVTLCYEDKSQQQKYTGINPHQNIITTTEERGRIVITTGITWNKIYRRSLLMRHSIFFPEVRCVGEDNYFCAMSSLHANMIAVSHKAEYLYHMNSVSQTHVLKQKRDFHIIEFYKQIENGILNSTLSVSEKKKWFEIINKRKAADYKLFYNTMDPELREEFKKLYEIHLNVKYLT